MTIARPIVMSAVRHQRNEIATKAYSVLFLALKPINSRQLKFTKEIKVHVVSRKRLYFNEAHRGSRALVHS